jgi:ATP-binding cassette subfamily B protein
VLAIASLAVGLLEAAFLVVASRTALAITSGSAMVPVTRGVLLDRPDAIWLSVLFVLARLAVAMAGVRASVGLAYRVSSDVRSKLVGRFIDAGWSAQRAEAAGSLHLLMVQFPERVADLVVNISSTSGAALSLLAMLAMALVVDAVAALVVVVSLAVLAFALHPLRRRVRVRSREVLQHQSRLAGAVAEFGAAALELRVFGRETQTKARLSALANDFQHARWRIDAMTNAVSPVYVSLGYLAMLAALAAAALANPTQLASVGAVMVIMLRTLGYGQQVQGGSTAFAQVVPLLEKIDRAAERLVPHRETSGGVSLAHLGPIELTDVQYRYDADLADVLRGISLRLEPGESLGVVGPSGGGKSTLLQLLLGLVEPTSGTITVGGVPLSTADWSSWTSRVALVPQQPTLLAGTIADNLTFLRANVTNDDMEQACRLAHLWTDVCAMPDGLLTRIGNDRQLSGGQRQRLAIARALVGRPELLILDEPTSAADIDAETAIRDALISLQGNVTLVVVSHRISTVEQCDKIAVLCGGTLEATGTPAHVSDVSPFYQRMLAGSSRDNLSAENRPG